MEPNVTQPADAGSLELMPRSVRDKLDRVGLKMHLKEWQACSLADRQQLCDLPCGTDDEASRYAACVNALVRRTTGQPAERMGSSGSRRK